MTRDGLSAAAIAHRAYRLRVAVVGSLFILGLLVMLLASLRPLRDALIAHFSRPVAAVLFQLAPSSPFLLIPLPMLWLERRSARRFRAPCPNCGRSVLAKWRYVLETNLCPFCGSAAITEE
ncbi:MAG: hypothetical protein GXX96_07465 [Planctomycetaceae bacterium]|jgi:RNA polymerase subunit RPABC4/transcription elongation factor Spt4|nr:hypothetical protein [Planctomycetaceae bacterium]